MLREKLKLNKKINVKIVKPPEGLSPIEDRNFVADPKSFSRLTGWQPVTSLTDGIGKTIEFFLREE